MLYQVANRVDSLVLNLAVNPRPRRVQCRPVYLVVNHRGRQVPSQVPSLVHRLLGNPVVSLHPDLVECQAQGLQVSPLVCHLDSRA